MTVEEWIEATLADAPALSEQQGRRLSAVLFPSQGSSEAR